jgi:hypothetical protein
MLKLTKYSSKFLQLLLLVSLVIFTNACSGGGSGNGPDPKPPTPETEECPTDEARCEARQNNGIN